MQTKNTRAIEKMTTAGWLLTTVLGCSLLAGCSGNPTSGSPAYKQGELGNGGFLFGCDDTVSCERWSGDAKRFPDQISTGASFSVRFVASGSQTGTSLVINDKRYDGITTDAVGPYVSKGPEGLVAVKAGYASVVARDSGGTVIDFATLKFVEPDALVVYDANWDASARGYDVTKVQSITMKAAEAKSYRTLAEHKLSALAGAIRVEWTSSDPGVVEVESYTRGVVKIVAKGQGKATLTVEGGALSKTIDVEVTQ